MLLFFLTFGRVILILSKNLLWFLNIIIFKIMSAELHVKVENKAEEAEFIFILLLKYNWKQTASSLLMISYLFLPLWIPPFLKLEHQHLKVLCLSEFSLLNWWKLQAGVGAEDRLNVRSMCERVSDAPAAYHANYTLNVIIGKTNLAAGNYRGRVDNFWGFSAHKNPL